MRSSEVAVLGWAAVPVGRYGPRPTDSQDAEHEGDLACEVMGQALQHAGVPHEDVDALIMPGPAPATTQQGFANFVASRLGLKCRALLAEVSNLGMSGGLAFDLALNEILLRRADIAMVAGVEMPTTLRAPPTPEAPFAAVTDVHFEVHSGATPISWYAMTASRYLHETGASRADLAAVAVKNRRHATLNPLAQFRKPVTVDHVLQQRPISEPLGLLDVAPISDGAICMVLGRRELAGSLNISVKGRGFGHDGQFQAGQQRRNLLELEAAREATTRALKQAALTLGEVDLAELYAPTTITEILVAESIGLCPAAAGAGLAVSGDTALGGRLPVNTSGGCLSRGHPPGLSGLYGLLELCEQLADRAGHRQVEGARHGLSLCEGGLYNTALAHVLGPTS